MSHFVIKPASPDRLVRDPKSKRPLAEKGERKPRTSFWLRRLKTKDVVEVKPEAPAEAPAEAEKGDTP